MPFSIRELLLGIATPTLIAAVLGWAIVFFPRSATLPRCLLPVALVTGFLSGYWLLELGPLLPKLNRDWTPYAAVIALPAAVVPAGGWRGFYLKAGLICVAAGLFGWWLVPNWPALEPSREVYLAAWTVYTSGLALAMLFLAFRLAGLFDPPRGNSAEEPPARAAPRGGHLWLIMMAGTLLAAFAFLPMTGSLRFALIAGSAFGAMAGTLAVYWLAKDRPPLDGVAIVYALTVSALMLTAKVNTFGDIPTFCYALLPLAPLAIAIVPASAEQPVGIGRMLLALIVAVAISGTAVGVAAYVYLSEDAEYSRRPLLRNRFPQQSRLLAMQIDETLPQSAAVVAGGDPQQTGRFHRSFDRGGGGPLD